MSNEDGFAAFYRSIYPEIATPEAFSLAKRAWKDGFNAGMTKAAAIAGDATEWIKTWEEKYGNVTVEQAIIAARDGK